MFFELGGLPLTIIFGAISIVLGIVVMIFPKSVPYLLGIYLIVYGIWAIIRGL